MNKPLFINMGVSDSGFSGNQTTFGGASTPISMNRGVLIRGQHKGEPPGIHWGLPPGWPGPPARRSRLPRGAVRRAPGVAELARASVFD